MKTIPVKQTLILAAFLAAFSTGMAQRKEALKNNINNEVIISSIRSHTDGSRVIKSSIEFMKDGKSCYLKLVDLQVTELTIGGKRVPEGEMAQYKELIDFLREQLAKTEQKYKSNASKSG